MSNSSQQNLKPGEVSRDRRSSSFSLSGSLQSVRRAVSRRGKSPEKSSENLTKAESFDSSNPFADPPPAYTPTPAAAAFSSQNEPGFLTPSGRIPSIYTRLRGPESSSSETDKFRFLAEFDTVFLIDDSSSMKWNNWGETRLKPGEISRWEQTRNVIEKIVPVCMRYDQDGVDIYFLNDPYAMIDYGTKEPGWSKKGFAEEGKASHVYAGITDAEHVRRIFNTRSPSMYTPTGARLGEIMKTYIDCYQQRADQNMPLPKPLNIIVITDGEASDRPVLRSHLILAARRLDEIGAPYHQLGVQFIQVGKDRPAALHLRELDDHLGKRGTEARDIVDCVTWEQLAGEGWRHQLTADTVLKIVLGAVNKRLDNLLLRQGVLVPPEA
ncbi:hypothetical protein GGS21DRAFT_344594 [Xylaria nigripes]|nr:hypothetical protein GGS21DRAFT_344594 [Xylaria nigripes]